MQSCLFGYPLPDNNRGWHSEWFYIENHGSSLPSRSGRQPDSKLPSWEEGPTVEEQAEVDTLLEEIANLKERGLTADAVVIDFMYRCIQPLKDRIYPAYLYVGASDPTRETARSMTEDDVKARVELMLRGEAHNEGTPKPYSAWNPTPTVSNLTMISLSILARNHILIHEITAE